MDLEEEEEDQEVLEEDQKLLEEIKDLEEDLIEKVNILEEEDLEADKAEDLLEPIVVYLIGEINVKIQGNNLI